MTKMQGVWPRFSVTVERHEEDIASFSQAGQALRMPVATWVTVSINGESHVLTPEQYAQSVESWLRVIRKVRR